MRSARVASSLAASRAASAPTAKPPRQPTRRSLTFASLLCLALLAACAAPVAEQATAPEPRPQSSAAATTAPAAAPAEPAALRPGEPEPGTREARSRARDLARGAAQLLNEGELARATEEIAVARRLDPDNALASCLERGIEVDPVQALGRDATDYRVRAGDTLGALAEKVLGDACQFYLLARYNGIEVPRQLEAGRTIRLPGAVSLAPATSPSSARTQPAPVQLPAAATGSSSAPTSTAAGSTPATTSPTVPAAAVTPVAAPPATPTSAPAVGSADTVGSDTARTAAPPTLNDGAAPPGSTQTTGNAAPAAEAAASAAPAPAPSAESSGSSESSVPSGSTATAETTAPAVSTAPPDSSAAPTAPASTLAPSPVSVRPPLSAEAQAEIARLHRRAQSAFRRQDLATAIGAWSRVLDIDPENSLARARREEALEMQRRLRGLK